MSFRFPRKDPEQFLAGEDEWPLVQVGPGIATLNFTDSYHWDAFLGAALPLFDRLLEAYAVEDTEARLDFSTVHLRYINALEHDPTNVDTLGLLEQKFHTVLSLPKGISSDDRVGRSTNGLQLAVSFPLSPLMELGPSASRPGRRMTGPH